MINSRIFDINIKIGYNLKRKVDKNNIQNKIRKKHKKYFISLLTKNKIPLNKVKTLLNMKKPNNYYGYAWDNLIYKRTYTFEEEKEIIENLVHQLKNRFMFVKKHYDNTMLYNVDYSIILFLKNNLSKIDDTNTKIILKKIKKANSDECFEKLNQKEKELLANFVANNIHTDKIKGLKTLLTKLLLKFRKETISYPDNISFKEWIKIIDEILLYLKDKDYHKGKEFLKKYFNDLWI